MSVLCLLALPVAAGLRPSNRNKSDDVIVLRATPCGALRGWPGAND
jgi:hypothetical protein